MKITNPNNRKQRKASEHMETPRLRILNRTGLDTGLGGVCRAVPCSVFAHAESAVPIRMTTPKIAIMNFGNRNTSMNVVPKISWISAATQIFDPGSVTIFVPHTGQAGADASVSSNPHFEHLRTGP